MYCLGDVEVKFLQIGRCGAEQGLPGMRYEACAESDGSFDVSLT